MVLHGTLSDRRKVKKKKNVELLKYSSVVSMQGSFNDSTYEAFSN